MTTFNRSEMNLYVDAQLINGMIRKAKSVTFYPFMVASLVVGYNAKQRKQLWTNLRRDLRRCGYEVRPMTDGSTTVYL